MRFGNCFTVRPFRRRTFNAFGNAFGNTFEIAFNDTFGNTFELLSELLSGLLSLTLSELSSLVAVDSEDSGVPVDSEGFDSSLESELSGISVVSLVSVVSVVSEVLPPSDFPVDSSEEIFSEKLVSSLAFTLSVVSAVSLDFADSLVIVSFDSIVSTLSS